MRTADTIGAELKSLTTALGQPGVDLDVLMAAVVSSARQAVASYLGISVTMIVGGHAVALASMRDVAKSGEMVSTAAVPLSAMSAAEPGSVIVLYAGQVGAWVDFAADLSFALGIALDTIVLDEILGPPPEALNLTDLSMMNHAIGILVACGHAVEDAGCELQRLAHDAGITMVAAAHNLVERRTP